MIVSYRVESIIALTGEHDQLFALLIRVPTHRMADAQMGHFHARRRDLVHGFDLHLGISFCFSEGILALGDSFFRPVEIDCGGEALLKKRQQIAKSGCHLRIDTAQSGVLLCHLRRVTL
jgi:hypothetical protein